MSRLKSHWPAVTLATGGLVIASVTLGWVLKDQGILPPSDSEHHLFHSIIFARTLRMGGLPALFSTIRALYVGWPPATQALIYGPLGWLFGEWGPAMRLYGLVLVPLLLWGLFRLGELLGDRKTAVLAALLALFSTGISGQLRQVSLDLPCAVAVLFALLALMRCQGFSRSRWSLAFGAACALCLMTRVQSVFFLAGPALVVIARALWQAPDRTARLRLLWRIGLSVGVALAVSSPYWAGRLRPLMEACLLHADRSRMGGRGDSRFWAGVLYYLASLGRLAGWPVLAVGAGSLVVHLCQRARHWRQLQSRPWMLVLVTMALGGILGCSLGVHREDRYMIPVVPVLALLSALALRELAGRIRIASAALVLASVAGPTLALAFFPAPPSGRIVRFRLVEWAYVRHPARALCEAAARQVAVTISKFSSRPGTDSQGKNAYLLFLHDRRASYLHRLGIFLAPRLPYLTFSSTLFHTRISDTRWHIEQRRSRRMFILTESIKRLRLPLIWMAGSQVYENEYPLRLYMVPRGHPLCGPIGEREKIFSMYLVRGKPPALPLPPRRNGPRRPRGGKGDRL